MSVKLCSDTDYLSPRKAPPAMILITPRASGEYVGCELRQQPDGPVWSARAGLRSVADDSRSHPTLVGDEPIIDSLTAAIVIECRAPLVFHLNDELVRELVLRAKGREEELHLSHG